MSALKDPNILERRYVSNGEVIIEQGDMGQNAFLIQSGDVVVYTESAGKKVELARMGPGQIIGEMALVAVGLRTATVQAVTDCNLIVITRETLNEKLQKSDPTVRALVTMLMKRLAQSNKALLRKGGNLDDMMDVATCIYEELHSSVPAQQKKSVETAILPPLDAFLKAIRDFQARYGLD